MFEYIRKDNIEVVEIFLNAGMDVNKQTWNTCHSGVEGAGTSPLMLASIRGNIDLVRLLIEHGADINASSRSGGLTPLMFASQRGHTEVVKYLIGKGADVNKYGDNSMTALMIACVEGSPDIVRVLLECGADRNLRDKDGNTALMLAEKISYRKDVIAMLKK